VSRQIHPTIFALLLLAALVGRGVGLGAEPKKKIPPIPLPLLPVEQAWITTLDATPAAGGAMDDERVYIPLQPEAIQALRRDTGAKVWQRDIETAWPPLLSNGVLYVAASDEIHALDPATGDQKWRVPFEHPMIAPLSAVAGSAIGDPGSALTSADLLIGVFEKGIVIAFAADDGRMLWSYALGATSHFAAVSDGMRAFFALDDSRVVALNLMDGARAWERTLEGMLNEPSVARDRVFVGSNNNFLYALDNEHGRLAWRWRSGGDVIGISADTKGGAYYASLDNVLRAVNRGNGNQRWLKEIPTRPLLPPRTFGDGVGVVFEEIVVLTGVTSEIDAFAAKTGAVAGMYMPTSDIQGPPLIDPALKPYGVAMVVITRNGFAIGLRPTAMMLPEPLNTPFTTDLPGRKLERERFTR
jgi:outer membrane protein assembly factor BamB